MPLTTLGLLREVNITYNFPTSLVSKLKLTGNIPDWFKLMIIQKNLPDADPESD
jgi:hypothetical protein